MKTASRFVDVYGRGLLTGTAITVLCATAAMAAEPADPAPARGALEEVLITAQRVEERLQDVPISVAAITTKEMERRGIYNITDLPFNVPNLAMSASPMGGNSGTQIFLRGVGQFDYITTQEPNVPIYVDGIYVARTAGSALDLFDIERVEVLRGPQGTLFGRNALGGAIQVITPKPTDELSGRARFTVGRYDRRDVEGTINLPIVEKVSARITAASLNRDGYGTLLPSGIDAADVNNDYVRGQIRFQPDETLDIILRADTFRRKGNMGLDTLVNVNIDDPGSVGVVFYNMVLAAQGLPIIDENMVQDNPYIGLSSRTDEDFSEVWGTSLEINKDFGGVQLKSLTAYRALSAHMAYDFDSTPYPLVEQNNVYDQDQISQEIHLSGKAMDDRLKWIIGGFYFKEDAFEHQHAILFQPVIVTGPGPYDFVPDVTGGVDFQNVLDQKTTSYAGFGQLNYAITEKFSATVGLRYSHEKKELTSSFGMFAIGNVRPEAETSDSWNNLSPKFGLEYHINDDAMVYVSASRGFRSGGFNGREFTPFSPGSFDPEKIWAYEVGMKSEWMERRVRLNVSGYYYDYTDYQGNTLRNLAISTGNIASVEIYGMEIEGYARPVDDLDIFVGIGYNENNITDVDPNAIITIRPDTQLPQSPKWTVALGAQYTIALSNWGTLALRGDYFYKSAHEFFLPNFPSEHQKGYSIVNSRVVLAPESGRWELHFFVQNLTDKKYKMFGEETAPFGTAVTTAKFGRPREWGASLQVNF